MSFEIVPTLLSSGGVLAGIAAIVAVGAQRKSAKDETEANHSGVVMGSYGELVDRLEKRLDVVTVTVERQGNEIESLKVELRDRDDQIKLLTLDRDDLIELVSSHDVRQPPLRTV